MFKLKKFIWTALLCAGVLAQFGAKENNPTECDKYGHLWVSSPQPLSCVGSVKCPNPTVTISQYTEYTPFFISTLRPGRINTTKRCSRCGAKGDASETRHDVSSVMEGANPGSPVNSNTPGTYLVTLTQYCTQCGEVAKGSCRITVVAGGVPPTTPPDRRCGRRVPIQMVKVNLRPEIHRNMSVGDKLLTPSRFMLISTGCRRR